MPARTTPGRATSRPWRLPRLGADAPDPELAEPLAAFGRFVGDWTIEECRYRRPEGSWGRLVGELHWRWILRGRALQDVWTLVEPDSGDLVYEGTTVRFYDPRRGTWSSLWLSATAGRLRRFVGRVTPATIVLDEIVDAGRPEERWVFAEIEPDAFRWYAETRSGPDAAWERTEEMRIRRSAPPRTGRRSARTVGPLFPGAAATV